MSSNQGFRKWVRRVHLWLGLGSGAVVCVVALTGCLYAFEPQLRSLVEQPYAQVDPRNAPRLLPSRVRQAARQALFAFLGQEVPLQYEYLSVFKDPGLATQYYAKNKDLGIHHLVYLNPYSGQVLKVKDRDQDFFGVVLAIHMHLLLPVGIGEKIVGGSALVLLVSLLTGLVLWVPKSRKGLKQRFSLKGKVSWRRRNYDLHQVLGFYVFGPLFIIALTGSVWSFGFMGQALDWLANGGEPSVTPVEISLTAPQSVAKETKTDQLFRHHFEEAREVAYLGLYYPTDPQTPFQVDIYPDGQKVYNAMSISYDPSTGQKLRTETFAAKSNGEKVMALNFDFHTGKVWGVPGQVLAFLSALVAASLPVTGCLIWYGRNFKPRHKHQRPTITVSQR